VILPESKHYYKDLKNEDQFIKSLHLTGKLTKEFKRSFFFINMSI